MRANLRRGVWSRSEAGLERNNTNIVFSEIESLAQAVGVDCKPPTVDAGVQQVEEPDFL